MNGTELVEQERRRQIDKEGWTPKHDDEHDLGELALAAVCYASPIPLFGVRARTDSFQFYDPWPDSWDYQWDKRKRLHGDGKTRANADLPRKERIRNLVKAGALIAAEIDRLQRLEEKYDK